MTTLARAALLILLAALGQVPPRDGSLPTVGGTASLSGVVITDDAAGAPARRARVWLANTSQGARIAAVTDDSGRFSFLALPAGRFTLTVEKAGYVTAKYGAQAPRGQGVPIALTDGQSRNGLVVRLTRGAVLTGRVVDEDGAPVDGANVAASERAFAPGTVSETATTDETGTYRMFGLMAGRYVIRVDASIRSDVSSVATPAEIEALTRPQGSSSPSGQLAALADHPRGFVPVFYPGVTDPEAATVVAVGPGEERAGIDVTLRRVPTAAITGSVIGPDGRPAANILVMEVPGLQRATTDDEGRFRFTGLSPALYTLTARGRSAEVDHFAMSDVGLSGTDVSGVTLQLRPGAVVSGRLTFERAATTAPLTLGRVSLRLAGDRRSTAGLQPMAEISADGSFRFASVPPGSYRLDVSISTPPSGRADWFAKAISWRGGRGPDSPVDIGPGDVVDDAVVALSDRVIELSGRLVDQANRPAPELFVIVFPTNAARWHRGSNGVLEPIHPATDGRFTFRGVPSGEYYLAALTTFNQDEWFTPAFLEQVVPGAIRITIGDGEQKTQDLQLAGAP